MAAVGQLHFNRLGSRLGAIHSERLLRRGCYQTCTQGEEKRKCDCTSQEVALSRKEGPCDLVRFAAVTPLFNFIVAMWHSVFPESDLTLVSGQT